MGEKTVEIKMDEFIRLCRVDARMDSLLAYIKREDAKEHTYSSLDTETVKLLIGMVNNESL